MTVIDRLVSVCVDIECESCWNTASGISTGTNVTPLPVAKAAVEWRLDREAEITSTPSYIFNKWCVCYMYNAAMVADHSPS